MTNGDESESDLTGENDTSQVTMRENLMNEDNSIIHVVSSNRAHMSTVMESSTWAHDENNSIISMTSSAKRSLSRRFEESSSNMDSSTLSLEWDYSPNLTSFMDPLNRANLFSNETSLTSSTSDDVFFSDIRTSTPKSRRITRSMSAMGDISPNISPIRHRLNRRHRLRQGLRYRKRKTRVTFQHAKEEIKNLSAARFNLNGGKPHL